MEQQYWHQRWNNNEIGFHQSEINSLLAKHLPRIIKFSPQNAFVPLCGKSKDLLWLTSHNLSVTGCELSPIACEHFFVENSLTYQQYQNQSFRIFSNESIRLYCGDFFDLTQDELGVIDFCYDRAALIALPTSMREKYAKKITNLLAPGCHYLLITMSYQAGELIGPPFSVNEEEINRLYSKDFSIKLLDSEPIPSESIQGLTNKGATELVNHVFLLRKV